MINDIKKELTSFRLLAILLTIAVLIYLSQIFIGVIGHFSDVIIILLSAWVLSFILEPVANKIAKVTKLSLLLSAFLVYLFFAVVFSVGVVLFIPIVTFQLETLSKLIPEYLESAPRFLQNWNSVVVRGLENSAGILPSVANFFVSVLLVLILSFYLIVDKQRINEEMYRLAPSSWHRNMKFLEDVINDTVASFLRIQVIFAVLQGVLTWVVLTIFGVPFASSTSLIAGFLAIVPLIGPILGLIPPTAVALISSPNNPSETILIFAILLIAQQVIYNSLAPRLFGKAFQLHPIIIFLSFILGYKIAGGMGAILAVPVLGILSILIKEYAHNFINVPENSK